MPKSYKVGNLVIKISTRGVAGYYGATLSTVWRPKTPFIAAIGNPSKETEPELFELLRAPDSTALHLGSYDDSRKAAYVTAYYQANKEDVLTELYVNGEIDVDFPAELFDLPEIVTLVQAQVAIAAAIAKGKAPPKPFDITKGKKALNKAYNFKVHKFNDLANLSDALKAMEKLILGGMSYTKAAAQVMETYTYRR